jgi:hypothetical protein
MLVVCCHYFGSPSQARVTPPNRRRPDRQHSDQEKDRLRHASSTQVPTRASLQNRERYTPPVPYEDKYDEGAGTHDHRRGRQEG